jgi:predicted helicase
MHLVGAAAGSVTVPRSLEAKKKSADNVTDWALIQFRTHYETAKKSNRSITKDAIFHYVYAVLHDPIYHEKYSQNLKREFPRIPFYADFWKWAEWGEKLMALHTGYETVKPWKLAEQRIKHEVREADDNVYKKGFIVDVNVQLVGGKPAGYRVTNVHQVIDLPD